MLRSRLVVILLLDNTSLIKTKSFRANKYVGDPLNTVRIFNEKEVDELVILDISCRKDNREPSFDLIKKISSQCQMPLCYGGGINNITQVKKLIDLGVEKISFGYSAVHDKAFLENSIKIVGSQSIVVSIDLKKSRFSNSYKYKVLNASKIININPIKAIKEYQDIGVGEILLQSIDKDGLREGHDKMLLNTILPHVDIPITVVGGISDYEEIKLLNKEWGPIGIGAGSLFVFQGIHRAVLINYPKPKFKIELL